MNKALSDGRHLRAARVLSGMTRRDLADAARVHPNTVRYWEAAKSIDPAAWAVDRMLAVLADHRIETRLEETSDGPSALIRIRPSAAGPAIG